MKMKIDMFSQTYKYLARTKKYACHTLTEILESEKEKNNQNRFILISKYLKNIQVQLKEVSLECIHLIDNYLLPLNNSVENRILFLRIKADHYRHLCDSVIQNDILYDMYAEFALTFYSDAYKMAINELSAIHQNRLGLALNFSVHYYEILGMKTYAIELAQSALNEASHLTIDDKNVDCKSSKEILSHLNENVQLWAEEILL